MWAVGGCGPAIVVLVGVSKREAGRKGARGALSLLTPNASKAQQAKWGTLRKASARANRGQGVAPRISLSQQAQIAGSTWRLGCASRLQSQLS